MILMKILVAIILTTLQRSESRANVKKTYYAAYSGISGPKRIPEARMVKTDVIFEVSVESYPEVM